MSFDTGDKVWWLFATITLIITAVVVVKSSRRMRYFDLTVGLAFVVFILIGSLLSANSHFWTIAAWHDLKGQGYVVRSANHDIGLATVSFHHDSCRVQLPMHRVKGIYSVVVDQDKHWKPLKPETTEKLCGAT